VVPGPERLGVLAPPALLDRLDGLARSPVPGVVVAAAEYDGSAPADGPAAVTARFQVVCPRAGDHPLTLPLGNVRLERVELDGHPADLESRAVGYHLTVGGAGRHELTARFEVPVSAAGGDREVR